PHGRPRGRRGLWSPDHRQQLRLRHHPASRAPHPGGRRHPDGRPRRRGASHRHPLHHRPHLAGGGGPGAQRHPDLRQPTHPDATPSTGNLTNGTLPDRTRRRELPIGVAYGTDPERVLGLLAETASSISGVLANPAPMALFLGFGDSALNFELRAWTDHFEEWSAIRSKMAVAVNNRLKAEGIEIPFPQRDVNLRYPPKEETCSWL